MFQWFEPVIEPSMTLSFMNPLVPTKSTALNYGFKTTNEETNYYLTRSLSHPEHNTNVRTKGVFIQDLSCISGLYDSYTNPSKTCQNTCDISGSSFQCHLNTFGSCNDDFHNLNSFWCVCEEGFEGKLCTERNPCGRNPCDPQGTESCKNLNDDFLCLCKDAYEGTRCENPIKACESSPGLATTTHKLRYRPATCGQL